MAYLVSGTLFLSSSALLRPVGRMRAHGQALAAERLLALGMLLALSRWIAPDVTVLAVFVATLAAR